MKDYYAAVYYRILLHLLRSLVSFESFSSPGKIREWHASEAVFMFQLRPPQVCETCLTVSWHLMDSDSEDKRELLVSRLFFSVPVQPKMGTRYFHHFHGESRGAWFVPDMCREQQTFLSEPGRAEEKRLDLQDHRHNLASVVTPLSFFFFISFETVWQNYWQNLKNIQNRCKHNLILKQYVFFQELCGCLWPKPNHFRDAGRLLIWCTSGNRYKLQAKILYKKEKKKRLVQKEASLYYMVIG